MQDLLKQIQIRVNEKIYLKDPETSELGKRIIQESIRMIDEIGLESFTFRKLSEKLGTTESSVYRYFENKHKLLIYLTSWYWGWQEYRLVFNTANISVPEERLRIAIRVLTETASYDDLFPHINTQILNKIVICESSKAYLTKEVDQEKKMGFFAGYDRLCERISEMVLKVNPLYKNPHTLVSTIIEGIQRQKYFIAHMPSFTDILKDGEELTLFFTRMALIMTKSNGKNE
ncbi:MAG: TetR/AcrR family transcriptional regulator [Cyclobacteriaceae bacterium]|nr:TetR/AcrR family transcriptional regulator [Cyclobacteriaceae bacterium]